MAGCFLIRGILRLDVNRFTIFVDLIPLYLSDYAPSVSSMTGKTVIRTFSPTKPGPAREPLPSALWVMVAEQPRYRNIEHRFRQSPVETVRELWAEYVKYTLKGVQAVVLFRQVSACVSLDTGAIFTQRTHVCGRFAEMAAKIHSFFLADVNVRTV